MSRDTCQDYLSQSLQLFPAVSVDGVTQTPKVQLIEQVACGYRLGHFPLTPCFVQRHGSGRSSFFRRHQGGCVVYGWVEGVCTALVKLLKGCSSLCSLLWDQVCFKGVLLLWSCGKLLSAWIWVIGSWSHSQWGLDFSGRVLAMDDPLAACRFESLSSGGRACWCCLRPSLALADTRQHLGVAQCQFNSLSIHLCYTSHLLTKQRSGSLLLK